MFPGGSRTAENCVEPARDEASEADDVPCGTPVYVMTLSRRSPEIPE